MLFSRVNFVVTFCRKTSLQRVRGNLNQNPSYDKMVGENRKFSITFLIHVELLVIQVRHGLFLRSHFVINHKIVTMNTIFSMIKTYNYVSHCIILFYLMTKT